ncbi:ImmA/IrrE family metallo-endopeptidase [Plantibacter sp. YIM 135249]|uniref:ImmA/IrrE family metallo-endopeptidase n=1 Tax=Plantibacter sp. YIM 135249 TaxID=3423918 RepID=UPI003D33CC12
MDEADAPGTQPAPGARSAGSRHLREHVYGIDCWIDDPRAVDYDPWLHADRLGIPVIARENLPTPQMVACYSARQGAIFIRPNLHGAVERCALSHEIVHFEHRDIGTTRRQEDRADRFAARRLIRPSVIAALAQETNDVGVWALELSVTERIMRAYLQVRRELETAAAQ